MDKSHVIVDKMQKKRERLKDRGKNDGRHKKEKQWREVLKGKGEGEERKRQISADSY